MKRGPARKSRKRGRLALVLHSHLPFVRHPEFAEPLEENWLFECMTETYIPLLLMMRRLANEGIAFRLTMSLTPTLVAMFEDPLLRGRFLRRLDNLMELSEKEVARTRDDRRFGPLARSCRKRLAEVRDAYTGLLGRDLTGAFASLQETGYLEILASSATHAFLPLLKDDEPAVRTQIRLGTERYKQAFGREPCGFWLPECGYYPGLDRLLADSGIRHTVLETHGLTRAQPGPIYGVYAPVRSPAGLALFGRDPDSSRQVWSAAEGYPGDYNYREFYRDIAYDLDAAYIAPHIHPAGIRIDTGFKYYRITGKTERKKPYNPRKAADTAVGHAGDFIAKTLRKLDDLGPAAGPAPLFVAPFDTELFGHWWHEGPLWLEALIREMSGAKGRLRMVTLSGYLEGHPDLQEVAPPMSSWGEQGYNSKWLNPSNDWIYKYLYHASKSLRTAAASNRASAGLARRALNQAFRELLLAQASDWAFMMEGGKTARYAAKRIRTHLIRIDRLVKQVSSGAVDPAWLQALELQDNIFGRLDYRDCV
jgi:1,4-alpha-glucan branching enzyme